MNQVEDNFSSIIESIKRHLAMRDAHLLPPLPQEEVEAFESRYQIRLPDSYRRFLLEIGNAGDGPPHYGLRPLSRTIQKDNGEILRPQNPFPLKEYWVWEDDEEVDETLLDSVFLDGLLYLGTDGCAQDWVLIVSGEERGNIWQIADVGAQPCAPRLDFLSWYQHWLQGRGNWFEGWASET